MKKLRPTRSRSKRPPPIPVRAVDFVMYSTRHIRRTRAFYQKLFGFKPGREWNDGWSEFHTKPVTLCLDGGHPRRDGRLSAPQSARAGDRNERLLDGFDC